MFFEGRTLKRRRLWTLAACALLAGASGLWLAAPGKAGTRLERPITIVVTFPPGGGTDLLARRLGCLLYTSPSPRDLSTSRMPSSA